MSRDIVEAAKNLVMLDIAMPNAEVAFGLYKNMDEAAAKLELRKPEKATTLSGAWRPRDPVDDDQGGARA